MTNLRKTKIVATIGPSSSEEKTLVRMIEAGMNVARINCSHGSHEEYKAKVALIRRASAKAKTPVAILMDLGGQLMRATFMPASIMRTSVFSSDEEGPIVATIFVFRRFVMKR